MDDLQTNTFKRLNVEHIQELLTTDVFGKHQRLLYTSTVPSTNALAMKLAQQGSEEGVVILADNQTAGKGRQGRRWVDVAGNMVLSSTVLRPLFPPYFLIMVASLAVVDAVADVCGITASIKWPNDVLIEDHKVAGILIETSHDHAGQLVAILGIGVNVNGRIDQSLSSVSESSQTYPGVSIQPITLEEACGQVVSREAFIASMLRHIEIYYLALQQEALASTTLHNGAIFRVIREKWRNGLSTLGRHIQVRQGEKLLSGVAEDVNDQGELLLRDHSGEYISITWGDIC